MTSSKLETAQQVDHRAEALNELEMAREAEQPTAASAFAACAQVYASLAIAEELKGIREALSGRVEGRYRQALNEIAGLAVDESEPDDNKVRERAYVIATKALQAGEPGV